MYTDGLTEAFSPDGQFFGENRLIKTLRARHMNSADDLLGAAEDELKEFIQSTPLSDDLTMLAVRRVE